MFNIFQSNQLLVDTVASSLGYAVGERWTHFTEDMYMQAFFYLSKRFGQPTRFDELKEAGAWHFKVDEFQISIHLNSSYLEFMVYGRKGNTSVYSPYIVKLNRERGKKSHLLIHEGRWFNGELRDYELKTLNTLFDAYVVKNNIPEETTQEEFNEKYLNDFHMSVLKYNHSIAGVDYGEINSKYGDKYENAYTRKALRVLSKFLKNMLVAIWIRDVPYNIKGHLRSDSYELYERYKNNIKIELK